MAISYHSHRDKVVFLSNNETSSYSAISLADSGELAEIMMEV